MLTSTNSETQKFAVINRKVCRSDLILWMHGRHETGVTQKGVQKDLQSSNLDAFKDLKCQHGPKDSLLCIRAAHVQHVGVRKRRVGTIRVRLQAGHYTDHVFGDLDDSHIQDQT